MLDDTSLPSGLFTDDDHVTRCVWCRATPEYQRYHDHEWGLPVSEDGRLFEKICLEGFQAGLSWLTILKKREAFRLAFAGFDMDAAAAFDDARATPVCPYLMCAGFALAQQNQDENSCG
jgi:DNA-3-methyladenine glycosylase I